MAQAENANGTANFRDASGEIIHAIAQKAPTHTEAHHTHDKMPARILLGTIDGI